MNISRTVSLIPKRIPTTRPSTAKLSQYVINSPLKPPFSCLKKCLDEVTTTPLMTHFSTTAYHLPVTPFINEIIAIEAAIPPEDIGKKREPFVSEAIRPDDKAIDYSYELLGALLRRQGTPLDEVRPFQNTKHQELFSRGYSENQFHIMLYKLTTTLQNLHGKAHFIGDHPNPSDALNSLLLQHNILFPAYGEAPKNSQKPNSKERLHVPHYLVIKGTSQRGYIGVNPFPGSAATTTFPKSYMASLLDTLEKQELPIFSFRKQTLSHDIQAGRSDNTAS